MREPVGVYVDPRSDDRRVFRVLLVDDEPDILRSVQRFLEGAMRDVRAITAPGGEEALAILRQGGIDLIVTDYKMPAMNGLEFLSEARRISPRTPALMMTAFPDLDLALKAVNDLEVEKFLTKPLDPAKLVDIVQEILLRMRGEEMRGQAFRSVMDKMKG